MPTTYRKSPAFKGGDLVLSVGRSQIRILDGHDYTDQRLAKFVQAGMLVEVPDAKPVSPPPAPVAARVQAPTPPTPPTPPPPVEPVVSDTELDDDEQDDDEASDPVTEEQGEGEKPRKRKRHKKS